VGFEVAFLHPEGRKPSAWETPFKKFIENLAGKNSADKNDLGKLRFYYINIRVI
jgi:hypothetical protein